MNRRWLAAIGCVVVVIAAALYWRHRASVPAAPIAATAPSATPTGRGEPRTRSDEAPAAMPVLADDDPPGALRLEGQVLGADDHPVGGAVVVLGSNPPRTATTEADGSFAFDKLVGRAYTVIARAPAGVAGPVTARLTEKSEPVVLRLRAGAKLAVTVVGIDGQPVDGATVELRGVEVQTTAAAHGSASFSPVVPGMYEVVAWAPGMAHAAQRLRIAGEAKARIVLASGAPVAGRVVDEQGGPIANARVMYVGAGEFRGADPRRDAAVTGADGGFRFAALAAGSVRFLARHDEHASGTSGLVTLDGKTETTGVTITLPAGAEVRGRVVDTSNQPVVGARVEIGGSRGFGRRGGGGVPQPPRQTYSDASGEFVVKGLPRGELSATASHERGAAAAVSVDTTNGAVTGVVLRLDLTATIAGVVVDEVGQPVEGAQVMAAPRMDAASFDPAQFRGRRDSIALTDAAGRFTITGLAQGPYSVTAFRGTPPGFGRRGRRGGDGVDATAGDQNVRVVLPAEGGVKGKVALADGGAPAMFTVSVGGVEQSFAGDSAFALDAVAPGEYQLMVRGPSFDTKAVEIAIEPGKLADVGTITVTAGRKLAGVVVSNGQPVANATVYAGRQVMGGGATNDSPAGGMGAMFGGNTKTDTTAPDGTFALAGFGDGDLTIVAELVGVGRSKALRVTEDATNQTQLTLELQPYGSISGVLHQDASAAGVAVTAQATSTPGAVYVVQAGSDGAYSFDRLAPDTYKVSATLGMPRRGMHFYSKQVDVPPGKHVSVDLSVDGGSVTVEVTAVSTKGAVGMAIGWLASAALTATTYQALQLQLAAAGAGNSHMAIARGGVADFADVAPGTYAVCMVPMPAEVQGMQAIGYLDRHASKLAAFCKQLMVAESPATQATSVTVEVPALIPDPTGTPGTGRRPGGGGGVPTR